VQDAGSTDRGPTPRFSFARGVLKPLAGCLVLAVLALTACARSGAEYELRLGHDQTVGHPYHQAVERFAGSVAEATDGAVQISIFPAAQLGDSREQIEGLRLGTLDLALAAFSHVSQFCSAFGLFSAPFLFEDDAHFAAVFDGEVGGLIDESCRERYSVRLLSTLTSGYRVLFNGRRPVADVSDLEGLKIRVMGGEADALSWQVFGAIPVPMPYSEVYSALQAGVIDGAENEPVSILSNKFYEAAHYLAPTNHLVLPMGLFISQRTLERLPEAYRAVLWDQAREAAVWEREFVNEQNARALSEMQERFGVQVSRIATDELRRRSVRIQDQVAEELELSDLLEKVRASAR
jgi:tripartite ATP-independent transporter DctP family solute receptor